MVTGDDLEQMTTGGIPDTHQPIFPGAHDMPTVRRKSDARHYVFISSEAHQFPPGCGIPNTRGPVTRSGHREPTIGRERNRSNQGGVALQTNQLAATSCVPDARRFVEGRSEY